MKNRTFVTTLVSLLAPAVTRGGATRRASPLAFSFTAPPPVPFGPSCFPSDSVRSGQRSSRPCTRSHPAARHGVWSGPGGGRGRVENVASTVAARGPGLEEAVTPGSTGGASRAQRRRRRWRQGGGGKQQGWFTWGTGILGVGQSAGRVELAAAASPTDLDFSGSQHREGMKDRCIRRLDLAVRRVFADYYSSTDVREATASLGVFLKEATAALGLDSSFSPSRTGSMSPAHLASRLKARLLESAERRNYHLDGDQPMILYRLWTRGRAVDVYERDLFHCPRWIELIAETKRQMDNAPVVVEGNMGTICYPSGDIFEGHVDTLIRNAKAGNTPAAAACPPTGANAFIDAVMASSSITTAAGGVEGSSSGGEEGVVAADVRTVSGLVSLTIDCLEDGLSDEATILQRHMRSPDFGHPLLRLASPSGNEPDHPHVPDDPEMDPALIRADEELTEEHLDMGERGAKELMLDRRRAQLDVYLVCAAYRQNLQAEEDARRRGGWHLDEEDGRVLDEILREAAATNSPWS